jgi:hypothetical protein
MSVVSIFSPDWFEGGQLGTQFVANPFGTADSPASDVWIQCAVPWSQAFDTPATEAFGIIEIEFVDDQGQTQQTTFGDVTNLSNVSPGDLPPRLFVSQLLSVTLAMLPYNTIQAGTVTLFQWG